MNQTTEKVDIDYPQGNVFELFEAAAESNAARPS
jgi:hypothetical protein